MQSRAKATAVGLMGGMKRKMFSENKGKHRLYEGQDNQGTAGCA